MTSDYQRIGGGGGDSLSFTPNGFLTFGAAPYPAAGFLRFAYAASRVLISVKDSGGNDRNVWVTSGDGQTIGSTSLDLTINAGAQFTANLSGSTNRINANTILFSNYALSSVCTLTPENNGLSVTGNSYKTVVAPARTGTVGSQNQLHAAAVILGQTTNATPLVVGAYTVPVNCGVLARARVIGRNTANDDVAIYEISQGVNRAGAGAALIGTIVKNAFESAALAACDVAFVISTNDVQVQVTGIAATTIDWEVELRAMEN